ncbi:uncharacterized protein N7511_007921 [Penicillium nucicola]|uniref:uncharacterized protein n=1 Tax=Penicillium nucicola TaxID=1850975 RepID=UPI00254584FE|nr:uncharacterized protein N7511_007921 [Penicillium nucicola]KAJ5753768.1 hypothetical protein N7511_007921 [Penicillium nucicola]
MAASTYLGVLTQVLVIYPTSIITASALCCLFYLAFLLYTIRFKHPPSPGALHVPTTQSAIQSHEELEESTSQSEDQSHDVTLALEESRWQPANNGPLAAEYPIQVLYDCEDADIDIVAVHGLGANPDYAWVWQPKNNPLGGSGYPQEYYNWLKDLLPIGLSSTGISCRVMTFNYDSSWFMNAPQQRLSNISDSLLDSLRTKREKTRGRPLIFVGHSFGGNLIEQTILSAFRRPSYQDIAESCAGVVFLGTPHRGSAAATWGAMIACLAPAGLDSEIRILKDLEEHSGALTDRLHEFSCWLFSESVPVVCCFEQLKTDYSSRIGYIGKLLSPNMILVPETSACIDGHHKISLKTDHLKINKFYGPDDPSYKSVYPEIERMAQNAGEMTRRRRNPRALSVNQSAIDGALRTCLQEMRVTNPHDILSDIQVHKGKRIGHTCEWILKREEFSAWCVGDHSHFLRLTGPPGIGKTMMCTFLIDFLKGKVERSDNQLLAYFFCDDKIEDRKMPTAILRSLIWQLLLQRTELFEHLKPDYEERKKGRIFIDLFDNFAPLWRIFQAMLQDDRAGDIFIAIDALDECDKPARRQFLLALRELFQTPRQLRSRVKFLITCRQKISDIEYELHGVGELLELNSRVVNTDLIEYIDHEVEELAKRRNYISTLKYDVAEALKRRAEGTFLWVSLMLSELKNTPNYEVPDKLNSLPEGLEEAYITILNESIPHERRDEARFLLLSMASARRPLKRKEIATSFALWKTDRVVSSQNISVFMDICSLCSSIIYQDDAGNPEEATVTFCHQSLKDFLLDERKGSSDAWYYSSPDEADLVMFQVCWRYLSSDEFDNGNLIDPNQARDSSELNSYFQKHCFLKYASSLWITHAIASYPALLGGLEIDISKAPSLRDAWLIQAAGAGQLEVFKLLCNNHANLNSVDIHDQTSLLWAAKFGHKEVVQILLAENVNLDTKNEWGRTPFSWAAHNGHNEVVEMLLATENIELNSRDNLGRTPLCRAAKNGQESIVARLLQIEHIEADSVDNLGRTPLSLAAEGGGEGMVRYFLALDQVEVDLRDKIGRTPLSWAAENGHLTVVQLLLSTQRVDPSVKDNSGHLPLWWAAENGHESVSQLLRS